MGDLNRKYAFNLPWRAVVLGAGCYVGLAVFMGRLAKNYTGAICFLFVGLSLIFAVLALVVVMRRLIFPRVLELSEDAIQFPRGFPMTRFIRINYKDIIRMSENGADNRRFLQVVTGTGRFEIGVPYLPDRESYIIVRDIICSKTLIAMPRQDEGCESGQRWSEFPAPILRWIEPEDWSRYRTGVFRSQPLFSRLGRALWFLVRCFGVIVIPWLILILCGLPTSPAMAYLPLALTATLFFTLLYWLYAAYPVRTTEIIFRDKGMSQYFGKQIHYSNYHQLSGWAIVERPFEGRALSILLLQSRTGVRGYAVPASGVHERVARILQDKNVPHVSSLSPPWE